MPQLGSGVPIEGLGLSIRFTSRLRAYGITTVRKLVEVLAGNHEGLPIRSTREGYSAFDFLRVPDVLREVRAKLEVFRESGPVSFATLTRLETEVLDLIVEGRSNRDISRQLGIKLSTVGAQFRNILSKTQGRWAPYTA
jgi:DNA-binding NarL/FixJ family response regulator